MEGTLEELRRISNCPEGATFSQLGLRKSVEYYGQMADHSLQIRPIAGALGAEIAEIDLSADLDEGTVAAIRQAWLDHLVILFRGQNLPP
jgi:hypothetical protein